MFWFKRKLFEQRIIPTWSLQKLLKEQVAKFGLLRPWRTVILTFVLKNLFLSFIVYYFFLQRYSIASARELARLTNIRKSPILNHYGESISGAATIRGFHQEERFMETNFDHLDIFGRAYFHTKASREWLIIRMEMLSTVAFTLFLIFLVGAPQGASNPSMFPRTSRFLLTHAWIQYANSEQPLRTDSIISSSSTRLLIVVEWELTTPKRNWLHWITFFVQRN